MSYEMIALLMFGELYTAQYVGEAQMRITEGQTISYAEDIRSYELAVTDVSDPKKDVVTVIPGAIVDASAPKKGLVDGKEEVVEEETVEEEATEEATSEEAASEESTESAE